MKNYSYISLLTNDSYAYGIALLVESMKKVDTKYPLKVLVTNNVSKATQEMLLQLKVNIQLIDTISVTDEINEYNTKINAPLAATWKNCWTKFKIFDLIEYDKIVFLDADIMVLKNLDHLFELPHMTAALDGEYFGLWQGWPHFNSGCLVIEPNHQLFEDILNFSINYPKDKFPNYVLADQEMLNLYFKDWPEKQELHLNKYYNVFAPYILESQIEELDKECYFIHYVGRKPWKFWVKNSNEIYTEYYYTKGKEMVESICKNIDWKKVQGKLKLTVYAICKNEKENVDKWLKSFGLADYVCILDTGSTDGTWELLQEKKKEYNNLIIDQKIIKPWRYDKARDESIKLIPKDTVIYFMADLDEIIKENDWVDKVKTVWTPLFDRGMYDYHRDVNENGKIVRTIKEYRIHSGDWTHWVNIVHEALVNTSGRKQFYIETCTPVDIEVWHFPDRSKKKSYVELCEQDLKEFPNDYIMRLQLAIEYEIEKKWDKAFEHYKWLLDNPTTLQSFEIARCFSGVAKYYSQKGEYIKALAYFREGRLQVPSVADNYLDAARLYYELKKYKMAGELCEDALRVCGPSNWCNTHDINSYYTYYVAGLSYYYQKDLIKALAYLDVAALLSGQDNIINLKNEIANQLRASWKK